MYDESQHQYETDRIDIKKRLQFNSMVEKYVKGLETAKINGRVPEDMQPKLNEALDHLKRLELPF